MPRLWICAGAANGFIAIAFSAFARHVVTSDFLTYSVPADAKTWGWIETGARYELAHAAALLGVGLLAYREIKPSGYVGLAGWAFLLGSILFSGSLYAMALANMTWLSPIVPLGGVAFLIGWGTLFFYGFSQKSR